MQCRIDGEDGVTDNDDNRRASRVLVSFSVMEDILYPTVVLDSFFVRVRASASTVLEITSGPSTCTRLTPPLHGVVAKSMSG